MSYLTNHKFYMEHTDWMSLPEMTNDDGSYCPFSCAAQTWSIATVVEAIYDAQRVFKNKGQTSIQSHISMTNPPPKDEHPVKQNFPPSK